VLERGGVAFRSGDQAHSCGPAENSGRMRTMSTDSSKTYLTKCRKGDSVRSAAVLLRILQEELAAWLTDAASTPCAARIPSS
jgi:hypothetical protein